MQKREYEAYRHDRVLIEDKAPAAGAALGLLPGGGSFYAREPVFGVVNLLTWPLSVLWDPVSGYKGALAVNYDVTKYHLKKEKEKEISALDGKLAVGELSATDYAFEVRKVDDKYSYD